MRREPKLWRVRLGRVGKPHAAADLAGLKEHHRLAQYTRQIGTIDLVYHEDVLALASRRVRNEQIARAYIECQPLHRRTREESDDEILVGAGSVKLNPRG